MQVPLKKVYVYVVQGIAEEGCYGVFSSEEKAEKYIEQNEELAITKIELDSYDNPYFDIDDETMEWLTDVCARDD